MRTNATGVVRILQFLVGENGNAPGRKLRFGWFVHFSRYPKWFTFRGWWYARPCFHVVDATLHAEAILAAVVTAILTAVDVQLSGG